MSGPFNIQDRIITLKSTPSSNPPAGFLYSYTDTDGRLKLRDETGAIQVLTGRDTIDTLTNKTITAAGNTISGLTHGAEVDNPVSGVHGVVGNVVGTTDDQELTTKVIVLKAGSATKAPFAFSAGPLLTTPLAGAAEFNNNRLYVTEVARQRAVSVAEDVPIATTTVANTITETTVYTAPIAANELKAGKMYRIVVLGRYATANATDTVTIKIKIGATELSSTVSTAALVSDAGVFLTFYLTVRTTGATGSIVSYTSATFDSVDQDRPGSGPVTVDTTVAGDVTVTATWSAADPGNTLAIEQAVSEVLN